MSRRGLSWAVESLEFSPKYARLFDIKCKLRAERNGISLDFAEIAMETYSWEHLQ
jgi:hypothetical protein